MSGENPILSGPETTTNTGFDRRRSRIISLVGRALHSVLFRGSDLPTVACNLVKGTRTTFDCPSLVDNVNLLKEKGKGIIILEHTMFANFYDYLPFFSFLGPEILNNTTFYTEAHNVDMNTREFPTHRFRQANSPNNDTAEIKQILKGINEDISVIQNGGYVFLIPSGAGSVNSEDFKGIFKRFVKGLPEDFPILSVSILGGLSYRDIVLKTLGSSSPPHQTILSHFGEVGDYSGKTGTEMKNFYRNLFS